MNKLLKILILSFIVFTFLKCNPLKKTIVINQKETTKPIIVKLSIEDSSIFGVKFSNKLEIQNKSFLNKSFIMIDYFYNDSLSKWANRNIELYKTNNEELKRISNNKKKTIPSKDSIEFVYYTRHFVDSSKNTQKQFKPYIDKMLAEKKDTLHIGTVTEFRRKYPKFFKKLTIGDSISIRFLDGKKLGERITVPVEW